MKIFAPLLVALLGVSSPIFAQTVDGQTSIDDSPVAYVGAIGTFSSEYIGSDEEDYGVLPYVSVDNYKGFDLFATNLSYRALETGTGQGLGKWSLRAGPSLTYQSGRDSDDSDTLTGLEDVDASALAGGYVRATFGPVGLRFNAGQDIIGGHDGLSADASIGTFLPLGRLNIQPSASVSWGSANHNESFFGISSEQSIASGLAVNDVGSGIYAYSLNFVSWYELNDKYAINLVGTHRWFTEEADDSPIILADDGADTGIFIALGITRKFNL